MGVPGPTGKRIVDDGGPDKHENDAGKHAATLSEATGSDSDAGQKCQLILFGLPVPRIALT